MSNRWPLKYIFPSVLKRTFYHYYKSRPALVLSKISIRYKAYRVRRLNTRLYLSLQKLRIYL